MQANPTQANSTQSNPPASSSSPTPAKSTDARITTQPRDSQTRDSSNGLTNNNNLQNRNPQNRATMGVGNTPSRPDCTQLSGIEKSECERRDTVRDDMPAGVTTTQKPATNTATPK
jgi:hypothetical protein